MIGKLIKKKCAIGFKLKVPNLVSKPTLHGRVFIRFLNNETKYFTLTCCSVHALYGGG